MKKEEYIACKAEITDWDEKIYELLVTDQLDTKQVDYITQPHQTFPRQEVVFAIHWHPEIVPMNLIKERISKMYPNRQLEFIIPTQHNVIEIYDEFAGVEVDCYSKEFNRKVQLLLHFDKDKVDQMDRLKSMLTHTFKYRSSQLFEYIETIINPEKKELLEEAVIQAGADDAIIELVKVYVQKLKSMIDKNYAQTPKVSIKNKLIRNYFQLLNEYFDDHVINKAQVFLKQVKKVVKKNFALDYFYETHEIIEEARANGAGIVVPHPEQFWPILLADYDVDGYEVWNPQSREFTEFLINAVIRKNRNKQYVNNPLLIFMGDDCHLGEKLIDPKYQIKEKARREIGYQPAWHEFNIRKSLILGNFGKREVIEDYKNRLLH